jgi:hypothetical protein
MKLSEVIVKAQKAADNASGDHMFVGSAEHSATGELGVDLKGLGAKKRHQATLALVEALIQNIMLHRANGGVGRGIVHIEPAKDFDGLVGSWRFMISAHEELEEARWRQAHDVEPLTTF